MKKLSRREFLSMTGITAGAAVLAACTPQVVEKTQIVNQTQIVESTKIVEQTKIVEKEKVVTATTPPLFKTIQGRELPADAAPLEKQVMAVFPTETKFLDVARDIYNSQLALQWCCETFLRNDENFELIPAACESWKAGPQATYWEFVLRKDSVWSDKTPVTSDDVVYTFQHMANPAISGGWGPGFFFADVKGVYKVFTGKAKPEDIGVVKVDDRTFQIYGEYGSIPYLPALLSYQAAVIVPKHVAQPNPEHWADNAEGYVCSGPYKITKWEHNKSIDYELLETYNGPLKPGIVKMPGTIVAGTFDAYNAFLAQEVYSMDSLSIAQLAAIRSNPKLNALLHFYPNFQSEYIALNTYMEPTDKLEIRQALSHAVDREAYAFQVMNGTVQPGYSMLPPGFPSYNPDLKAIQNYDVEKAKQLLAAAGVTDPATVNIKIYSNGRQTVCEFCKQQWEANLGIKVELIQLEGSVWGDMRAKHTMQAYRGPYEYDYIDQSNMLTGLWRSVPAPEGQKEPWGSPRHAWKNETFDKLVTDAGSEGDVAKRTQMFKDAEKLLVEEVGGVFMSHQMIFQIWWPWLTGHLPDKNGNIQNHYLDIARFRLYIHKDIDEMKKQYKQ